MAPSLDPWRRIFAPFAAGYFLSYLLRNANAVISPELTRDLGLTAADLGFSVAPRSVVFEPKEGYVFVYDYSNSKVLAYMGDNNNASDGPLIEVANTTDLSAVTGVRVVSRGKHIK